MNDMTIILRSLRVRLFSTVTTVLTAAVAVALMLVLLMLKDSGKKAFERGSGDMHLVVSAGGSSPLVTVLNCIFYANPPRSPLTWAQFEQLAKRAPWAYAVPTQQGDSFEGMPVMATSADFFGKFRPNPGENWKFAKGQTFTKPFEVVLGAAAAKTSGLVVGDQIYLAHGTSPVSGSLRVEKDDHDHAHEHDHAHDHDDHGAEGDGGHVHREFVYTVVGILEPTGGSHDRALFTDMTSSWILHAHDRRLREGKTGETTEADLLDEDRKITGAYLRLITREGSGAPANLPQVFDTLRRDGSLTVAQPRQEIDRLFVIVSNIDKIFLALAAAVLISSAIAIMLALYNSMEQRRRQIAVLRVLGASRWRVFGLIAAESLILGMLGWVVGVGIAVIGAGAAATALQKSVGLVIAPSLPAEVLVGVGLVTLVLAGVAGLIPAAVAYATPVVRNLRPVA